MATHSLGERGRRVVWACAAFAVGLAPGSATAQIINASGGFVYAQNFDSLITSGTSPFVQYDGVGATLPGVFGVRTGSGTNIFANDGSNSTSILYSFGTGTAADRALGSVGGAAGSFGYGVVFQNTDTQSLNISVQYTGEQWRRASASVQTVSFAYKTQSAAPTSAGLQAVIPTADLAIPTNYTGVSALNFASPNNTGATGALDGNATGNRTTFNQNVAVNLAPNDFLVLYWSDPDHPGTDHGLGIDDLQVTFTPVPEPATVLGVAVAGLGLVRALRRGAA